MPAVEDLMFYFKITPVEIIIQPPDRLDRYQHWMPPERSAHFRRDSNNSTGWCRWSRRGVERVNIPSDPEDTKICSLFYDYGRSYFLLAEADCSRRSFESVAERYDGEAWRRLGFRHVVRYGQRMSLLQFDPSDDYSLREKGGRSWMPELLPLTYDGPNRNEYANIAGELSILLGFAAFTCEPLTGAILDTIHERFRLPYWIPRNTGLAPIKRADISRRMGYIVKVAPFPGIDLQGFEDGWYGPLLVGRN